jgi:hypothetical protein
MVKAQKGEAVGSFAHISAEFTSRSTKSALGVGRAAMQVF